jgi:UDP-glucose 4-epimerase
MSKAGCNNIVFSSSATVYGKPEYLPYDEEHPTNPVNPYGRSKLTIEIIINDWIKINAERKGTILRYFNPVGAHESGMIGEEPNGTAERDFIHVMDLASAYVKSLERKNDLKRSEILNIGRGTGVTVLELIKNFESASGEKINYNFLPRRSGDLPSFWANSTKAFKLLNWKANISIYEICQDTWRWQSNNLNGYDG